jgi:hypothetical protein
MAFNNLLVPVVALKYKSSFCMLKSPQHLDFSLSLPHRAPLTPVVVLVDSVDAVMYVCNGFVESIYSFEFATENVAPVALL